MNKLKNLLTHKIIKAAALHAALLFLLFFHPAGSAAQEIVDTDPEQPGIQQPLAPVKVDGRELFNVRGISSFSAEQRAAAISKRIMQAAADTSISADSIRLIVENDHTQIFAGTKFIMNVFDADTGVEGINRELFAQIVSQATTDAIQIYRQNRTRPVLIRKSLNALATMIILTLLIIAILWIFRRIDRGFQKLIKTKIDSVENKSFKLIRANQLWKTYHLAVKILKIGVIVTIAAFLINYILSLFPWTNNVATYLLNLILDPLLSLGKGFLDFLPNLVFLVVIILVTRYILKLGKLLFTSLQNSVITIKNFEPEWAMPTFSILRTFIIVFAVIVAFPYIPGSGTSAFKGISVFMGILLSLGSSSFISNMIAGYTMTYRGAFKKGDFIQAGERSGYVQENKIFDTRLLSIQNEEIVIPNSVLLNSNIINYTTKARSESLIIHTTVGIGYETPWRLVDAMLKLAADRTEGLLKQPPPFVLKRSLGDFAITYEINVYCNDTSRMHLYYNALIQNILDVFNQNNVQIMTPAYRRDPEDPKVVPMDKWFIPLSKEE
jgi:small-conductance mechanosensitive channel